MPKHASLCTTALQEGGDLDSLSEVVGVLGSMGLAEEGLLEAAAQAALENMPVSVHAPAGLIRVDVGYHSVAEYGCRMVVQGRVAGPVRGYQLGGQ